MKKAIKANLLLGSLACIAGCSQKVPLPKSVPAERYSQSIREQTNFRAPPPRRPFTAPVLAQPSDYSEPKASLGGWQDGAPAQAADARASLGDEQIPGTYIYRSQDPGTRDYTGPLSLGDPGVSASLWQESRGGNDLFRDDRAWQAMDLITILVQENSEGKKEADTEVKSESTISSALEFFFGVEDSVTSRNPNVNPETLVQASTTNDFKGEGETNRKGSLKGTISTMVAEVLPSGILRIEGEKIIAVNYEEQVMRISGLVRPRDINSRNEVDSSKVANMRVDYFGKGMLGEYQKSGWGSRLFRNLWPF